MEYYVIYWMVLYRMTLSNYSRSWHCSTSTSSKMSDRRSRIWSVKWCHF